MSTILHLKFFASLREKLGNSGETIELPDHIKTALQVREYLIARDGIWSQAFSANNTLRMAYNQKMIDIDIDMPIADGGELAFFPPVTGG